MTYRNAPKLYVYRQNNSGGSFDAATGHEVLVEATSTDEADERAALAGVYFNGIATLRDCECCGDRWYPACEGYSMPLQRPLSAELLRARMTSGSDREGYTLRVLYADGQQDVYRRGSDGGVISKLRPARDGLPGVVPVELPVAPPDAWTIPGMDDD